MCHTNAESAGRVSIQESNLLKNPSPFGKGIPTTTPASGKVCLKMLPLLLLVVLFSWAVPLSYAQLPYVQDFDVMGSAGTTLPSGWFAGYLGTESSVNRAVMTPYAGNGSNITAMPVVVSDGSALPTPNVGTVFNLGTAGSSDRALGNYPRTTPSGDQIMQVAIQNNTGGSLAAIQMNYFGEQWRQSQGTSSSGPEMLRVLASTTSSTDGFTYFPSLDFVAPRQTTADAPVGGLDGNLAANRVFVSGTITFPTAVPNGGTFYVRWHDWNDNGTSDHFLAIDNVQIAAVPEPGTLSMLVLGLGALVGWRKRLGLSRPAPGT